jgi:tRNA(adenine34) deaminase
MLQESNDDNWSNYILYTTAEPCSMCMSAILWSGIGTVVYGSSIKTLQTMGWKQIDLTSNEVIAKSWDSEMATMGGVLEEECDQLFLNAVQKLKAS